VSDRSDNSDRPERPPERKRRPGDPRLDLGDFQPERRRPTLGRERRRRRGPRPWLVVGALLVVAIALGLWQQSRDHGPELPLPSAGESAVPAVATPLAGDRAVVLVFPEWDAMGFVSERRQIPSHARPDEDLFNLMATLCEGPQVSGAVGAIPSGTRPLAAFYDRSDRAVVLDFSSELVTRHPGGAAAEHATLVSILRTVALNFPEVTSCQILVDGAQVETLKGHVSLDRPFELRRWL
jgi:hypothetical protein